MKLIIDVPENIIDTIEDDQMISREQLAVLQMHILDGIPYEEQPQGEWVGVIDYIKHLKETTGENYLVNSTYYNCEVYCNKCWEMSTKRAKFCPNCGAKMKQG